MLFIPNEVTFHCIKHIIQTQIKARSVQWLASLSLGG